MSTVRTGDSASEHERRRLARQVIIGTELISAEMPPDNFGLIIDLTEYGAAIQAVVPLVPGERRVFRCTLPPERESLEVMAEVIWSRKNKEAGLRFVSPSELVRARIRNALELLAVEKTAAADPAAGLEMGEAVDSSSPEIDNHKIECASAPAPEFEDLLCRAVKATTANGVALAVLSEGHFVCRASLGRAPEVGVVIQRESGLSAECICTGAVVCCADTDNDVRVNPEVCRELGMASAVIVPIMRDGAVVALLECFWNSAHAYDEGTLNELYGIAESILEVLESGSEDAQPDYVSGSERNAKSRESSQFANSVQEELAVAGETTAAIADEAADAAAGDDRLAGQRLEMASAISSFPSDSQTEAVTATLERRSAANVLFSALIGVAVFVLVTIPALWYLSHRSATPASTNPQSAAGQQFLQSETPAVDSVELPSLSTENASGGSIESTPAVIESGKRPVVVTTLTVRPANRGTFQPLRLIHEKHIPDSAVRVMGATSQGGDQARRSAASPTDVEPNPSQRRGTVVLDVTVARDGAVEDVRVVSGDPRLAEAAKAAVAHWHYQPATMDGSPVPGNARVTVHFRSGEDEH